MKHIYLVLLKCYNYIIEFFCCNNVYSLNKGGVAMETALSRVNSIEFAIYLTQRANERNIHLNVTKLQKLLYICYGLYLSYAEEYLLDERPEAWQYGPFFPEVHKKQKENNDSLEVLIPRISEDRFKEYDFLIDAVLEAFGTWTAMNLVEWTHQKGTAWHKKYVIQDRQKDFLDNFDIKLDFNKFVKIKE